jgi:hypothetical protein
MRMRRPQDRARVSAFTPSPLFFPQSLIPCSCFKNYCPEVTIPASATDEYNKECTGSNAKGAAGMLAIPGVGLVAGVAGVMAML